jgi:CubicO group peptidase (beta-lactamase class C family)
MTSTFPGEAWGWRDPEDAGFDPAKLDAARRWMDEQASRGEDGRYRVVVVRGGQLIAEWNHGVAREEELWLASATKSIFSSMLAIAVDEGRWGGS